MQQQNGTKENATLNTQSHVSETNNNDYLTEVKDIQGTPFKIRRLQKGYFLTMGDQRLTDPTPTEEAQYEKMYVEMYNIVLNMIVYSYNRLKENDKLAEKTPYETESL